MDELVIPVSRGGGLFRAAVLGAFVVVGLAMFIGGVSIVVGHGEDYTGGYLVAAMGCVAVAIFGLVLVQALIALRSRLRLTHHGFELNNETYAWADVDGFDTAGNHVRVGFTDGARRDGRVKASVALGKLGLYTAPAYIYTGAFDTGGASLIDILSRWQHGDRITGQPAEPRPTSAPDSADRLQIRLKLSERIAPVIGMGAFFVIVGFGLPWMLLDAESHEPWVVIAVGFIWLVTTGATGYGFIHSVRQFSSHGLILHSNGFDYGKHTWAWADIDTIQPYVGRDADGANVMCLRVVFRPDSSPTAPADLPFGPTGFDTGGTPIDRVLRQWLTRYR